MTEFLKEGFAVDHKALADLLFPNVTKTVEDLEAEYPPRDLPEGAAVTRFAPSPTGFLHFGGLFPIMTSERLARLSGGVFYLRIEDTDSKREIPGAVELIINTLAQFGIRFDEGAVIDGDKGSYGPYRQRSRKEIYHVAAKKFVSMGLAYPCFCSEDDLAALRERQKAEKANFGYYGKWASCRNLTLEEIDRRIGRGDKYVLRFRSGGDQKNKLKFTDLVKGELLLTENDIDHVLLKSDGIPTYHFAHLVDDHLMRTTHVVRGDEWLSTLPFHLQLFDALGWKRPKYLHISPLMKMDGESKRKLSKRKDPEIALTYYHSEGYPKEAVIEYVMNTLNSNFEDWRRANPCASVFDFKFSVKKMSPSGALFDLNKLRDISKNVIAAMDAETVYGSLSEWAGEYDREFHSLITADPQYTLGILSIDRGGKKPRKDAAAWSDFRELTSFFFDPIFAPEYDYPEVFDTDDLISILEDYRTIYDPADDNAAWFEKIRQLAARHGCCPDMKLYRQDPGAYKAHVGDVSMVIRVAVCGRRQSPDLGEVMRVMGPEMVDARLARAIDELRRNGQAV
jgi:glutamyl-tRNA synthetase